MAISETNRQHQSTEGMSSKHNYVVQVAQLSQRDRATVRLKSVEILAAAAQLYEKSHLTRRIAISCGIKTSPVASLDWS